MTVPRFIQIHTLTAYPATLLNRDDAGLAKRLPFGGTTRTRVSSQCLKRHWRKAEGKYALSSIGIDMSVRSRRIFEELIAMPLIEEGLPEEPLRIILKSLQSELLGESAKTKAGKNKEDVALETNQVIVLGRPEIEFIKESARNILADNPSPKEAGKKVKEYLKENKKNLAALKKASSSGLDAALFGRMVTSDILARGDAAIHVAHAFTVHGEETESDYFTVVDDLVSEAGELGSAHINEAELTSGLFYGYVVVDVPLLISNIEGVERNDYESADRSISAKVIKNLIHLIAEVSPGAKKGSTAPYSYAELVMVESGNRQPRTLANAFRESVPPSLPEAVGALSDYLKSFDRMYGSDGNRWVSAMGAISSVPADKVDSLDDLADKVEAEVSS